MRDAIIIKTEALFKLPVEVDLKKEAYETYIGFCHQSINAEKNCIAGYGLPDTMLALIPLGGHENRPITDILEEGMYEYHSMNNYAKGFINILEELVDLARPLVFTEDDVFVTATIGYHPFK